MEQKTDEELYREAMESVKPEDIERMHKKMAALDAQQRAEERYPDKRYYPHPPLLAGDDMFRRQGYATCYREEVEPRDRLLQELAIALERYLGDHGELWGNEPALLAKAKAKAAYGIIPK